MLRQAVRNNGKSYVLPNSTPTFTRVNAQRFVATERGTVTEPAFSIEKAGDSTKGIYGASATALAIATGGAFRMWLESSIVQIANVTEFDVSGATIIDFNSPLSVDGAMTMESGRQFLHDPGSAVTPGVAARTDTDSGFYLVSDGVMGHTTAGVHRITVSSTGALVTGLIRGSTGMSFGSGASLSPPVAGTTIPCQGLVELNPTGGNVTMTATPTLAAAGITGQSVVLINRHATNSVTLQDDSVLAGSNLKTAGNDGATPAGNVVIGPGDTVIFVRGNVDAFWRQITPVMALNA